jgi:hypothetical protein
MKKLIATLAAVAALASTVATTEAMAGGKHKHRHHFGHFHYGFVHIAPRHECGFEYWKWKKTGSFFWKKQYYHCKGWW